MYTHTHLYIYTHTHLYIYTHTHTHRHLCGESEEETDVKKRDREEKGQSIPNHSTAWILYPMGKSLSKDLTMGFPIVTHSSMCV